MNAARNIFRLKEVSAITISSNTESQRLLEKLGFSFSNKNLRSISCAILVCDTKVG
jgi:hypothetical protein